MKIRCIITFVENKKNLLIDILNMYESFKESKIYENTDLIICAPKSVWYLLPKTDPNVIIIETNSISDSNSHDKTFLNYHYVNSISCITLNQDWLLKSNYEYILKTDCDVFLTNNFIDFFPDKHLFYTGRGAYSNSDNIRNKIKTIAKRNGYRYQDNQNIGATWYGNKNDIINVAKLTIEALADLLKNDFPTEGQWPDWYKGVSSMYASELAVNHLIDKNNIIISDKFDSSSTDNRNWKDTGVYHIHCWHTDDLYSKFKNINKTYIDIDSEKLDINKTNEYCLILSLRNQKILHSIENFKYKKQHKYKNQNNYNCNIILSLIVVILIIIIFTS
jgi:hypothetical protein